MSPNGIFQIDLVVAYEIRDLFVLHSFEHPLMLVPPHLGNWSMLVLPHLGNWSMLVLPHLGHCSMLVFQVSAIVPESRVLIEFPPPLALLLFVLSPALSICSLVAPASPSCPRHQAG